MDCHLNPPIPPVVLGFNHKAYSALVYQISAKLGNLQLTSYIKSNNLGAIHHSGFDPKLISTIPGPSQI